jgi:hypothetical protein
MKRIGDIFGNAAEAKATAFTGGLGGTCLYVISGFNPLAAFVGVALGVLIGLTETWTREAAESTERRQPPRSDR